MKEYKLKINGNAYSVTVSDIEENLAEVEVNGIPFKVEFENPIKKNIVTPPKTLSSVVSPSSTVQKPSVQVTPPSSSTVINVTSPLPGIILEVAVKEGDIVKKGQKLIVLEAMKIENVIEASADGKIISVKVSKGDSVLEGATLVTIGYYGKWFTFIDWRKFTSIYPICRICQYHLQSSNNDCYRSCVYLPCNQKTMGTNVVGTNWIWDHCR